MHIVVDGYNMILRARLGGGSGSAELESGREALVDALAAYKKIKPHKITVVFPPLSPAVFAEISANKGFAYVDKTVHYACVHGAIDLQDPARLGLTPAEFHDSLHTTARADAMVLRELARMDPELGQVIDLGFIEQFLASGREHP